MYVVKTNPFIIHFVIKYTLKLALTNVHVPQCGHVTQIIRSE